MTTDSTAMAIAEKRARSAKRTLDESRRAGGQAQKDAVTVVSVHEEEAEGRPPKPPLRYRLGLLLSGALVALALAAGAFVAFQPDDRSPSDGFDRSPASATDVAGPAPGFDPPR